MSMRCLVAAGLLFLVQPGYSLGPHQVALIVNANSEASLTLANHYAAERSIPTENRVHVHLPRYVLRAGSQISAKNFRDLVISPVQKELQRRGVDDRILAWIYSADFPVRINGTSSFSLTGFTLIQGEEPDPDLVHQGRFGSPLFAGVEGGGGPPLGPGYPFLAYSQTLCDRMPVPAMLLTHMGARGLTLEESLNVIRQGIKAEGTQPSGVVFFEQGTDIRARAREFQFHPTVEALKDQHLSAKVIQGLPNAQPGILGIQAGRVAANVQFCGTFRPGAYADHLTSFAADFSQYHQTKCTEWLRHGATGTSGPVVEPMAIWTKFPSARFFEHYRRGLTMVESLYAATASPLQTLFLGEPLSAPFNKRLNLALLPLEGDRLSGDAVLVSHPLSPVDADRLVWRIFIDGKPIGGLRENTRFELDTRQLADGFHSFGVEAYVKDQPIIMGYSEHVFEVRNRNQSVLLAPLPQTIDTRRPVDVLVEGSPGAEQVMVRVNGETVGSVEGGSHTFSLDPERWGAGPVQIRGVATFSNGAPVFSEPQIVHLKNVNQPPEVKVTRRQSRNGPLELFTKVKDPENDEVKKSWFVRCLDQVIKGYDQKAFENDWISLEVNSEVPHTRAWISPTDSALRRLGARMSPRDHGSGIAGSEKCGLIFGASDRETFYFFGYGGEPGSWVLSEFKDGVWTIEDSIGRPVFLEENYDLEIELSEDRTFFARVNGRVIFERKGYRLKELGSCGLFVQRYAEVHNARIGAESIGNPISIRNHGSELSLEPTWNLGKYPMELHIRDAYGASVNKVIRK